MNENERQKYEEQSKQLRADLKRFEVDWASRNGGTKPRREDIKQNPDIAQKYKKYNQVRDILAGKIQPPKESTSSRKRVPEESFAETPSKRSKPVETPSHLRERIIDPELFATPSTTRKLFSPAVPTSIGPTPHRDGRILGLFDLMDENEENTPSKGPPSRSLQDGKIHATPSKRTGQAENDNTAQLGRTPVSSSKRGVLFKTPSKRQGDNTALGRTPTSVSKLQLSTPSFLRRVPLATVDENGDYISPAPLRLPRKPLGRSLSSVVASLRKLEEEALDDDLEALHDMENDADPSIAPKPAKPAKPAMPSDTILEPDSQGQLLGGFDDEGLYDSPTEDNVGRDGRPLRIYKKKGQKRTTKRVNMKPTRTKRPQKSTGEHPDSDSEVVVPETQVNATKADHEQPLDLGSDSEFDPVEEGEEDVEPKQKSKAGKTKKVDKKADKEEGPVRKATRKVNELAHANFKRLKLRNYGAKGPVAGSRFRRRR
ncbi:DNA replication/checkpoint protein [Annulohypoxylon maeteangense]|uniref:DNA replication/checkpoint protein n=1 Tax=Annulohypoxylon maeteangense TaxID=1927788 RepID=UPI002008002D|nr:DNA replication/checkpoint protein [Annulohypoxylon maeteangense]KAI0880459.1 DNA replication/checkpoint protein [Annulohypoxylon maeteangense]